MTGTVRETGTEGYVGAWAGRWKDALPRGTGAVLAAWGAAALYWYLQGWWTGVHPLSSPTGLSSTGVLRASPLLAWAAVTPVALRGAARLPVRGPHAGRNALVHLGAGTLFVVLLNVATLLAWRTGGFATLWGTPGSGTLGESVRHALASQFHLALLVWAVLVGVGHLLAPEADRRRGAPPPGTAVGIADPRSGAAEAGRSEEVRRPLAIPRPGGGIRLVEPREISWIEADGDRVLVHVGDRVHPLRERMKSLEDRLEGWGFLRIHRSTIVNLAHLREIQPWYHGDVVVLLEDGTELRVARGRRESLSRALGEAI